MATPFVRREESCTRLAGESLPRRRGGGGRAGRQRRRRRDTCRRLAYIGGDFTDVGGTAVEDIAEIDTTAGAVNPRFGASTAGGQVETLLGVGGHLLVGGHFTAINGSRADPYMASVNPVTGKDDGFLHLNISGYYHYCDQRGHCTQGTHSSV